MGYRESVFDCAARRIPFEFPNGSDEHAEIITEAILLNSKSNVRLLTQRFDLDFYGRPSLIAALNHFLALSYTQVVVLIQERYTKQELANHPWVKEAARMGHSAKLIVRNAVGQFADPSAEANFSVMDEHGYRLEDINSDPKVVTAVANFYEPVKSKSLATTFDAQFKLGLVI